MTRDDELFEELQRLVTPARREPPPESIAALRAAVARKLPSRTKSPWWRQKITVGAAVFAFVAGTPAAAFALSGTSLPDPLRTALHAIGLPVDSVPVADTKAAEGDLEHALRDRNQPQITKAADHLQVCLAELDPADRTRMAPEADTLLNVAARSEDGEGDQARGVSGQPEQNGTSSPGSDQESTSGSTSGSDGSSSTQGGNGGATNSSGSDGGSGDNTPTTLSSGTSIQSAGSGSDGDQATTTTTVPAQTQTDGGGETATSTALQGGGGSSDGN